MENKNIQLPVVNFENKEVGKVTLPSDLFGVTPKEFLKLAVVVKNHGDKKALVVLELVLDVHLFGLVVLLSLVLMVNKITN